MLKAIIRDSIKSIIIKNPIIPRTFLSSSAKREDLEFFIKIVQKKNYYSRKFLSSSAKREDLEFFIKIVPMGIVLFY